jgi:hypothetical protein
MVNNMDTRTINVNRRPEKIYSAWRFGNWKWNRVPIQVYTWGQEPPEPFLHLVVSEEGIVSRVESL